ncbi:cytochrome c [Brumimicrobium glaciale]|jgi:mono/diheme cytochrome c family protein|uniref:Cytochrome c n=1 Tax=Brumimicrobium glaciale TaxID=200475 RepID=A0A4Q4KLF9_9FLAO|nr:cytochrome c [Brumimicrobium glaciale]RYM34233.1 cytochrome c [Brumimicrobium glaciale]
MKKKFKAISTKALVLTFGIGTLASCVSDPDSPGLEFMPDMYRSPAIETYVDYGWVKETPNVDAMMTQSAKHPPVNTIPYMGKVEDLEFYLPYHRQVTSFAPITHGLQAKHGWNISEEPAGDYFKSAEDKNPIELTEENQKAIFNQGKKLFGINCAHCHGEKGNGKGPMVESGAYLGVPDFANLTELADGQMFYSIYYGKGMMGAHAPLLKNKEIWTVVHYINKLQSEDYGVGSATEGVVSDSTNVEAAEQ